MNTHLSPKPHAVRRRHINTTISIYTPKSRTRRVASGGVYRSFFLVVLFYSGLSLFSLLWLVSLLLLSLSPHPLLLLLLVFYYITNIRVFFVSAKFSDIYLLFLTLISNSIFKPPWRLNGDGAIEGA